MIPVLPRRVLVTEQLRHIGTEVDLELEVLLLAQRDARLTLTHDSVLIWSCRRRRPRARPAS